MFLRSTQVRLDCYKKILIVELSLKSDVICGWSGGDDVDPTVEKVREVTLQRERDRQRQLQQIHVDRQVQNSKDLEAMEKFRQGLLLATGRCSSKKIMKLLPCKNAYRYLCSFGNPPIAESQ